ncbi:hypothetical protein ACKKBF_B40145 [Auxenochlorella protothecoides x Auxenochlorella symbiontica]
MRGVPPQSTASPQSAHRWAGPWVRQQSQTTRKKLAIKNVQPPAARAIACPIWANRGVLCMLRILPFRFAHRDKPASSEPIPHSSRAEHARTLVGCMQQKPVLLVS